MNRFFVLIIMSFLIVFNSFSQEEINNYKYIIVPNQFEFQKSEDQYQLNSLTKFLFNKYGYTAFLQSDEKPDDLSNNNCLALKAIVKDVRGGFLKTKMKIDLIDCKNNIIASSQIGETKVKEYKKAYNLVIRDAFETFQYANYKYNETTIFDNNSDANTSIVNQQSTTEASDYKKSLEAKEIERLKKEVEILKLKKEETMEIVSEEKINISEPRKTSKIKQTKKILTINETVVSMDVLYAQPTASGYQIVDTTPRVVMILFKTAKIDIFIVKDENAIVYKEDGVWYMSKHNQDETFKTQLNLKF